MKRIYLLILAGLAALIFTDSALAEISATIDRNQIAIDETLNLTLTRKGGVSFSAPDLAPLEKDFRILGRSQSSNTQIVNSSVSSSTTLNLSLAPKRTGVLEIPALSIGKERTESMQVKVVTQTQPKTKADNAPLFIETEVDQEVVPVQGQLLFTLRIFWAIEASIAQPSDPKLKDALLERLDDATFNKTIEGRTYNVFERKYAIFPQKSGELQIPQVVVQATIPDRRRYGNFHDLLGAGGREVKLRSESKKVTVLEKPPEYPADADWLPTDRLSIAEEWSDKPAELLVGESVTVTIAMAGRGLLAAQLPPIELPETDGLKLYQGKAEVRNLIKADGVTGLRKESIAIIPIKAGQVELPEIRVPWWDLEEGRVQYAVIPARQLTIKAASRKEVRAATPDLASTNSALPGEAPVGDDFSFGTAELNRPLLILSIFLALAWLVTLFMLVKARRGTVAPAGGRGVGIGEEAILKEKDSFRKLRLACRGNDPVRARKALIDWARTTRPGRKVRTGTDLEKIFPGSKLAALLEELDRILFGREEQPGPWHGKVLLDELEIIRKSGREDRPNKSALPALYLNP
jgi:hypothetical protein